MNDLDGILELDFVSSQEPMMCKVMLRNSQLWQHHLLVQMVFLVHVLAELFYMW